MKALIVHAHHEPESFCSALAKTAARSLEAQGYEVVFNDLYAQKFDPVSDRRNFTSVKNPTYLKQQDEEDLATETYGFSPELEAEIQKLEAADLLVFSFPLWWFGMPAILKGWVDRVFASGRVYGTPRIYEHGLGDSKKRALILMTTGGREAIYNGFGVNPPLETILAPIQHGVFWFNGFLPLAPFVAWSPARITPDERQNYLKTLEQRLLTISTEPPQVLPPLSDFPQWAPDQKKRYMATIFFAKEPDDDFFKLVPEEGKRVAELKRLGLVTSAQIGDPHSPNWRAFLTFRETSPENVLAHLQTLPLAAYFRFEITELLKR